MVLRVPRVQHSAWVPADQNTKIVLFGGVSGQAMNTAEVVGGAPITLVFHIKML